MSELEYQAFVLDLLLRCAFLVVVSFVVGFGFGWLSDVRKHVFARVWARRELQWSREVRRRLRARQG